ELKAKTAAIAEEAGRQVVTTGEAGAVRRDARTAVDEVARRVLEHEEPNASSAAADGHTRDAAPTAHGPAVGERVIIGGLGLEALVTAVHDGTADLDVRGKRMRASIRDLRVIAPASAAPARVSVNVHLAGGRESLSSASDARPSSTVDLNVIGCSVDEAIARAERFLDESLLTDQRVVRLIHGYGTGQLKRALAGFLQQHPLVARFATAPPDQGGGGVTVVELKE